MRGGEAMSFIPNRNRKRNPGWFVKLDKGLNKYLDAKNWLYDFKNENLQPKKQDIEARYLSQYFFCKLIETIDSNFSVEITDSTYMYLVKNKQKIIFHFDVMNNPKEAHAFGKNVKKICKAEWDEWNQIYHTIGNFTPVPWPNLQYGNINMQDIHKALDERWDLFLKVCQNEWSIFEEHGIYIDFQMYMKLTCQHIYFQEIYELFEEQFGDCDINEITYEELLNWHDSLDAIVLKSEQIISFGQNLNTDVKTINRLISLRGKLMMALVSRSRK